MAAAKRYNHPVATHPRTSRRPLAIAGVIAALALASYTAWAQNEKSINSAGAVLHRDLTPPTGDKAADPGMAAIFGAKPGEGQNPSAFAHGSKILPEPSKKAPQKKGEPVYGRGGFAADRDTQARPDYQTGTDQTLQYATVFNPSVLPFKRMSALDRVRTDYTLYTESNAREAVKVGGKRSAGRDLFWGSLVIQLDTGKDVPIPSVAPDMRILSYEVSPTLDSPLAFSKDDADNYYVRTDESGVSGKYRLVFLVDADARYFSGDVPDGYTVREASRRGRALVHEPPRSVQRVADRALLRLGVHRGMQLRSALDKLVAYFRNFEATDKPPPSTGDIYWDLFSSQAGVCRHRSFAFMVTANALGIPTRYVTNEAHAFVEVWVPETHWIRIDLGGAALRMEVSNANGKTIHRPRKKDSFPNPDKYSNNYTQLRGDIKGLTPDQIKEGQADKTDPSGDPDWNLDDPDADPDGKNDPNAPQIGPGKSLPTKKPDPSKAATSITVDPSVAPVGYRGESVTVSGRLVDDSGAGLADQVVKIWLAPAGRGGDDSILVGTGLSGKDGKFSVDVELPSDLTLRSYEVFASTDGDDKFAPSVSQ